MKQYETGAVTVVKKDKEAVGYLDYWKCNPPRDLEDDGDELDKGWMWFTLGFVAGTVTAVTVVGVIFG